MGQPRASGRKVITISSDEGEDPASQTLVSEQSDDELPVKPQKKATGKLRSVKKSTQKQQPTPANSTQNGGSQKSPAKSPAKPKASKPKGKTSAKEQPKTNAKPIYSFFNAATQRLQNSQPSVSPEKPPATTAQEEPEVIHDGTDDSEGADLHLAEGSSLALALRKRKVKDSSSFDNDTSMPPPPSQKFRKATSGERIPSFSVSNDDKRPWTDQFAPKDLLELAVHKKKVTDVRQWLEMTLSGHRQRVLVLKGAAGTGKTMTVRLLAKELGLDVTEWRNADGNTFNGEGSVSAALQFEEFLGRAGRSGGLQFASGGDYENHKLPVHDDKSDDNGQLLLVEEFPNTFSRSSSALQSFRSAIAQYLASPTLTNANPTPLVMVISETLLSTNTALADSFTAHRLLGPELSNHPFLNTIEFNPVAQTYLLKALETIVVKEARKSGRRRTPGPLVLKRLAESGDIRSAVSSLEFFCLRGDDEEMWSSKVTFTKQKKSKSDPPLTQSEQEALKLISNRESTLGIFHAVGKVVYNKRVEVASIPHPPPWLPQHRRKNVPENDVDVLIDELGTDTATFMAALHENYALSCSSGSAEDTVDSLSGCMDSISDADLLSIDRFSYGTRAYSGSSTDSLRQDEMAFQISVRGLWFNLPFPVKRIASTDAKRASPFQMYYPASLRTWKKREEIEGVVGILSGRLQGLQTTSAARLDDDASARGVDAWKRNNTLDSESMLQVSDTIEVGRMNSAKREVLLERLPYMAQIMSKRRTPPKLLEQLQMVTEVSTSGIEGDEDEADVEENEDAGAEQWATDRPDGEPGSKSRTPKTGLKQRPTKLSAGGGLGIPVETHVEKLVLEDDDIVDD